MKRALIGISLMGVVAAICVVYLFQSPGMGGFPYGYSSAGIQIRSKENDAAIGKRSVFLVSAGELEGEAIVTPVPSAAEGEAMVDSLIFGVNSAFQERPAPYGGQITALIACDSQKYVNEETASFAGNQARVVRAVASGRKIYGSCSAGEINYASVFLAGFDSGKKIVVALKLFKPVANTDEILPAQEALLKVFPLVFGQP